MLAKFSPQKINREMELLWIYGLREKYVYLYPKKKEENMYSEIFSWRESQ